MNPVPMIELKKMEKKFAEKSVLQSIDLTVPRGEIFGLLGPSGAGKTTMVAILTGQLKASGGTVRVLGQDLTQNPESVQEQIGIMMDQFGLYQRLSVFDNLKIFARIHQVPLHRVEEMLEKVGLADARKEAAMNLSKGMKSRLKLARALLKETELLFLDEPTSGLDPSTTKEIHKLLLEKQQGGATIFLTTHNMMEAQTLCDHVALLNQGRLVEEGAPEEICRKYNHLNQIKVHLQTGEDIDLPHTPAAAKTIGTYLEQGQLSTIHSTEPDLERVFLELTGRSFESP